MCVDLIAVRIMCSYRDQSFSGSDAAEVDGFFRSENSWTQNLPGRLICEIFRIVKEAQASSKLAQEQNFIMRIHILGIPCFLSRWFLRWCTFYLSSWLYQKISFCVSIPRGSLQFLVRVFTFLSLSLWYSYFGTFLSTWSIYIHAYGTYIV